MALIHRRCRSLLLLLGALALVGSAPLVPAVQAQGGTVKVEWLGWSFFRFTSPTGKVILTNPFIAGNPDAAVSVADVTKADLILVPDGHRDEVGNAADIAKKTGARIVTPWELATWLVSKGVPEAQVLRRSRVGAHHRLLQGEPVKERAVARLGSSI
jgi:hypothetical protein